MQDKSSRCQNYKSVAEISSFEPFFANRLLIVVIKYTRKKEF